MKNLLFSLFILLFSCIPVLGKELVLGQELQLKETTKVSEINVQPEKYLGKRVQIEGLIINVCAARGCWMDIASDVPFQKIQIKVVDGEIVFPMEAKGRNAKVEGIVEKLELSHEQALEWAKHKAMEQGEEFDPATITGPTKVYRIRGLGAVIM